MKIGTTSWLIPGGYLENVKLVAEIVDFVELLVFSFDKETRHMLKNELPELYKISKKYGLEYTVHLPTDCINNVKDAFNFFEESNLPILNYVVHPIDCIEPLLKKSDKISVENLKKDILIHNRTVFDIGHHILGMKVTKEFFENTVEFHLMGVKGDQDHLKLDKETLLLSKEYMKLMPNLKYICFEVFDINDFLDSYNLWRENL